MKLRNWDKKDKPEDECPCQVIRIRVIGTIVGKGGDNFLILVFNNNNFSWKWCNAIYSPNDNNIHNSSNNTNINNNNKSNNNTSKSM